MVVAPGFIDMLGQSELTILVNPHLPSKIFQGITTEITGEGGSVAPLNDAIIKADQLSYEHLQHHARLAHACAQYFARLEKQGMGINLASYVGATQVRRMVLGDDKVQPTPAQLEQMKALVREAMHDGAVGVSTSLQYAPAPYAKTEELIALAAEAAKFGGIYATHMRSEGDRPSPPPSTKPSASAARRTSRSRSGTSRPRANRNWGQHAGDRRADREGPRLGRRHQRRHLRLYRMVQHVFRLHSALGA